MLIIKENILISWPWEMQPSNEKYPFGNSVPLTNFQGYYNFKKTFNGILSIKISDLNIFVVF